MDNVSLDIFPGEVIGLVGKNGAGKSTLIRMLSGIEKPDAGQIYIDGMLMDDRYSPSISHQKGLAVMHQELANIPQMSVAENVALGSITPKRYGLFVDWKALVRTVENALAELELDISPHAIVAELTVVQQRMVMIARALYHKARLLVLDEPSTSLTDTEINQLHRIVQKMRSLGHSVVYISHRLNEIMDITDRVIVMQDGRVTATHHTKNLTKMSLVSAITGQAASNDPVPTNANRPRRAFGPVVLRARSLTRMPHVHNVSFDLRQGEILGIAGLVGAGRTEVARLLSGVDRMDSGEIHLSNQLVRLRSPRDGVRAGIVLLPEDRRHQGLVMGMSVRENITLASLHKHVKNTSRLLSRSSEWAVTQDLSRRLSIKTPGPEQDVKFLSGGNQQKVVLAKWLACDNKVLIFDEPTQGVDVHAKAEMFGLIRSVTEQGKSAIVISSDFSELIDLCDRIVVMREGRFVGELEGEAITEAAIVEITYGHHESLVARQQLMAA